jgi:hypothetical protein
VRHLRGQLPQYFQSIPGVTRLREQIHSACTISDVASALRRAQETAEHSALGNDTSGGSSHIADAAVMHITVGA